jgi:hypothetical protein
MSRKLEKIEAEALQLGVKSRAALAERLLQSLEPADRSPSALAWLDEAERRDQELNENGGTGTIPARVVLRSMKSEIARKRRAG